MYTLHNHMHKYKCTLHNTEQWAVLLIPLTPIHFIDQRQCWVCALQRFSVMRQKSLKANPKSNFFQRGIKLSIMLTIIFSFTRKFHSNNLNHFSPFCLISRLKFCKFLKSEMFKKYFFLPPLPVDHQWKGSFSWPIILPGWLVEPPGGRRWAAFSFQVCSWQ